MSPPIQRLLLLAALLSCMLSGCESFGRSKKPPPPTDQVVCPPGAYQYALGPVPPVGTTLRETEVEDAQNRARWGQDISNLNAAAACLRARDQGKAGVPR